MDTERERLLNALNCANMRMRRATRVISEFYDAMVAPSGLHANQVTLLIPPYLQPGMTINQLAQFMALDRTTLARNLKLLEQRHLIVVRPGEDQRTRVIQITDLGREALLKALPLWEKAQARVVNGLGEARLGELFSHLGQLESVLTNSNPN